MEALLCGHRGIACEAVSGAADVSRWETAAMTATGRPLPSKQSTSERAPLAVLQAENERLIALLEADGIEWRPAREPATPPSKPESSRLSIEAKVALFRRRFQGRTDVYPVRWESKATGKSGYAPACANEWRAG